MLKRAKIASAISVLTLAIVFGIGCGKTQTSENNDKQDKQQTQSSQNMMQNTQDQKTTDSKNSSMQNMDRSNMENMNNSTAGNNNSFEVSVVKLSSMQCNTCKKNITKALKKVDGVSDFNINVDAKVAKIKFDKSKTDLSKIENAITAAGYDANDKKADPTAYENLDDCCKLPKDRKEK
jgi:mercuric ion binding protein